MTLDFYVETLNREKPRADECATLGPRNPLYEKAVTPSSDSRTLTLVISPDTLLLA